MAGTSKWRDKSRCRKFENADIHDKYWRKIWHNTIRKNDMVIVLGDWSMHNEHQTRAITTSLPGHKILILGNHDRTIERAKRIGFHQVYKRAMLSDLVGAVKMDALLSHFPWAKPYETPHQKGWPCRQEYPKDTILLHGHTHMPYKMSSTASVNMCPEAWGYQLIPLDVLQAYLYTKFSASETSDWHQAGVELGILEGEVM